MTNEDKIKFVTKSLLNEVDMGHLYKDVTIKFNMKGKSAGQFRYNKKGQMSLRFNMGILEANGWARFEDTVPHEVAHLINYKTNGSYKNGKRVYPHGKEWKSIMKGLGYSPNVTHNYTIPETVKKSNTYTYKCKCMTHQLGKIRHSRMQRGWYKGKKYSLTCKKCKEHLVFAKWWTPQTETYHHRRTTQC